MYPVRPKKGRGWKWAAISLLLLLSGAVGLLFGYNRFEVFMDLGPDTTVTLDYGTQYSEPVGRVILRGSRFLTEGVELDLPVKTDGAVDTGVVGVYTVDHSAKLLWFDITATRKVEVLDRIAPVIELVSDPDHLTAAGQPYEEEGYSAWDEYDGDLTDRVQRREDNGVVYYTVTDASGNTTEVTRQIQYYDTVPPVIELAGGGELYLGLGSRYEEPGFTAIDERDGNLTENVEVSGTVDCRKRGSYTLTYRVCDESGNEAVVTRTVIVQTAQAPELIVPEGKVIYLTFDDGPGPFTQQLLEVLAKYDVKATFFVIGNDGEMLRQIVAGGHSIGIHSVSHNYRKIYASEEAFFEELYQMQDRIYRETGVWTTLLRFPGGSSNTVSSFNRGVMTRLTAMVQEHGFQYYDWNVDSDDAGRARDSETVFNNVTGSVQGRRYSIVLQHDIKDYSVEAVERIIQWGLANGYTFLALEPESPNCHHGVNN